MIWKPNVVVAAIVERDGKFLLVEEMSDGEAVLNQPAGHLDEGETLIHAVIRETLEETAWQIEPTALLGVYRWPYPAKNVTYLRFAFIARALHEEAGRTLDHGCLRALWLTPDEIRAERPRLRSPQVERCLNDYLAGTCYPLELLREYAPDMVR